MFKFTGLHKTDGITPINPSQEDGVIKTMSDRFITIAAVNYSINFDIYET